MKRSITRQLNYRAPCDCLKKYRNKKYKSEKGKEDKEVKKNKKIGDYGQ